MLAALLDEPVESIPIRQAKVEKQRIIMACRKCRLRVRRRANNVDGKASAS